MGVGPEPRMEAGSGYAIRLGLKCLMASFLWRVGDIVIVEHSRVKTKRRAKTKQKDLPCLLNGLVELLGESF